MAATVASPSGGNAAFREMKGITWQKLQNVEGVFGETSRMFITRLAAEISILSV
ncbi:MAG: hypothetical protein AMXMBFR47_13560 [Planctomycetota bacterium]